jgi:hypothetical protein
VNFDVTDEPVISVRRLMVLANVPVTVAPPLPRFVSVAWPVFTKAVPDRVAVPFTVSVLLKLTACAPVVISSARAKGANLLNPVT